MVFKPINLLQIISKKSNIIGLDIGTCSIKLAQFIRKDGKLQLSRLLLKELDRKKDVHVAQLDALRELFKDIKTQDIQVNAVINCPRSCTRVLTIPVMPKAEMPAALKWEMKNFISFSPDDAALDFEVLHEVVESGVKKIKVATACSPQETIDRHLNLLQQANIKPSLFTQSSFVLGGIISSLGTEGQKTVAVLDIGCSCTELFIFEKGKIAFNRKLPICGGDFTNGMTQVLMSELGKLQLSFDEAEKIKRKYGIPESASAEIIEEKLSCVQLLSLLRPNTEKLLKEIERSFDFYREKEHGTHVERLVLLGGGSNLLGLKERLGENLEIPVELGNSFSGLSAQAPYLIENNLAQAHRFSQALGVGLSSKDCANLLPVEIKQKTKLLIKRSSIKAAITAALVILVLSFIGMRIRLATDNTRISTAELELKALAPRITQVQKQAYVAHVLVERVYWSDVLKEMGNCVPPEIRITKMIGEEKKISLSGEIASTGASEEKLLTEFMNELSQGIFEKVDLITTQKGRANDEAYKFELKLGMD